MDKKERLETLIRAAHERGAFTGTWLYAENGRIVSKGAVGFRDPEDTLPLQEDSVFDLASVSKQFTATAVMLLRRRGLLSLDDEITRFFPQIPYKGVTIRHLLTHTGGLPDYMDWFDDLYKKENVIPPNAVIVRFLCECGQPPVFAPGEKWEYSNTGYCLLAQIVEEVSAVPFEDFLRDNIFVPAGMADTRVYHRRKDDLAIDNLAYGLVLSLNTREYVLPDNGEYSEVVSCDGVSGDGLVHSSVLDLYKWDRALRNEVVLTREEQRLMYTPGRLNSGEMAQDRDEEEGVAYGYGFGWEIENDPELGLIVNHSGGWPGYSTWFERYLDADRVLIRLRCRDARDEHACSALSKGMEAIARDKEPEPVRTIEEMALKDPDTSKWDSFCGKYEHPEEDTFTIDEVYRKGGDLWARIVTDMGTSYALKLYPLGENTFSFREDDTEITFGEDCFTVDDETYKKL